MRLMLLMDRTKKLKEFFGIKRDFRYSISFIGPSLGSRNEKYCPLKKVIIATAIL